MTLRQKELLDIIAASVRAASLAADELANSIPHGAQTDLRMKVRNLWAVLDDIADDARAEHASGLLCEVYEELRHAEADAARGCACDGCRAGGA